MSAPAPVVTVDRRLTGADVAAVRDLVERVTEQDGVAPFSEHVMLHLPYGGDAEVRHLVVRDPAGGLVGYAHLDVTDQVAGSSAELAVRPDARGRGIGRALVTALLRTTPDGRLRLWAHGDPPAAAALAATMGFARSRVLLQMRRPLGQAPLPPAVFPPDVQVRTFVVGRDEGPWTELNNRAFAHHPDQGRWGVEEVVLREHEPWFDPAGFFLAERAGRLVGFHWTKVHGGGAPGTDPGGDGPGPAAAGGGSAHGHAPIGEVYVVGVDPREQGRGLGPALTLLGLHSLQDRGLTSVLLYVDEGNTAAVRVYERLGFRRFATDVCFSRAR